MRYALLLVVLAVQGCMFADVRKQHDIIDTFCVLEGEVSAERRDPVPLVVVLVRKIGADPQQRESWQVADHFVLDGAGHWRFRAGAGTYGLVAFQDIQTDLKHQVDEPYLRLESERIVTCRAGEPHANIALNVPADGRTLHNEPLDLSGLKARSLENQLQVTLGEVTAFGEIATLSDARFADEVAEDGLWRPFDFLFKGRPGIYFLEPYDARKTPVLFVHGINGSPANFGTLIERLDRQRFQPWVYYYPSGAALDAVADHLTQTLRTLQVEHRFDSFVGRGTQHGWPGFARFPLALHGERRASGDPALRHDLHAMGRSQGGRDWRQDRAGRRQGVDRHGARQPVPNERFSTRTRKRRARRESCRKARLTTCCSHSSKARSPWAKRMTVPSRSRANCSARRSATRRGSTASTRRTLACCKAPRPRSW